uniref:Putative ovule protein n=1 Tax=Solanum chacoense TaxID=4108 RepID=A0A0V0H581_SOLCH
MSPYASLGDHTILLMLVFLACMLCTCFPISCHVLFIVIFPFHYYFDLLHLIRGSFGNKLSTSTGQR